MVLFRIVFASVTLFKIVLEIVNCDLHVCSILVLFMYLFVQLCQPCVVWSMSTLVVAAAVYVFFFRVVGSADWFVCVARCVSVSGSL